MAEEEVQEEQETKEGKKSSNLLMIIVIVVLILVILIGAVVVILLMGGDDNAAQQQVSVPQAKERSVQEMNRGSSSMDQATRKLTDIGILYPLDTFTVNLKSDAGRRYLKVTMSLELEGEELSIELDKKAPVLRDRIIRILTSKTLEEISSRKGKEKVSQQIQDTLNAMLTDGRVKGIYFTEFVIQ